MGDHASRAFLTTELIDRKNRDISNSNMATANKLRSGGLNIKVMLQSHSIKLFFG